MYCALCAHQYFSAMMLTTNAVHPEKGCPRKPWPLTSSYCSQKRPVERYCPPTVRRMLARSRE